MSKIKALYDLDYQPVSFDFMTYLTTVLTYSVNTTGEPPEIVVVSADNETGFKKYGPANTIPEYFAEKRLERIIFAGCGLAGADYTMFRNREQGMEYVADGNGIKVSHHLPSLVEQYEKWGDIQRLKSPHGPYKRDKPYITITLRESFRNPQRNSQIDEWFKFAQHVMDEGDYSVLILPDTESVRETNRALAEDVAARLGIYEGAEMNFGVNNGPMSMCFYSEAPCRVIKYEVDGSAGKEHLRKIGLWPPGTQMPFAKPQQRIVWKDDIYDNLMESYEEWRNESLPDSI